MHRVIRTPLTLLLTLVMVVGCSGSPYRSPEATVEEMYAAISAGDMDRYMDAIHPDNRKRPDPFGLLSAVSVGFGAGGFSLGADLSKLFQITVQDLELHTQQENGTYALVTARGKLRMPILMMEMDFCEQHDLRREGGRWYVDA